jgi:hypothetical protein
MVFNEHGPPARGGPSETILVNPEVVFRSSKMEVDEEGCLSFPKIYSDVEVGFSSKGTGCGIQGGGARRRQLAWRRGACSTCSNP